MTIIEMRKKRSETWEKAKNFLDTHRNASGILSAEDTATYERMEQEIVDLGHEIERQERLESMEREMQKEGDITAYPQHAGDKARRKSRQSFRCLQGRFLAFYPQRDKL